MLMTDTLIEDFIATARDIYGEGYIPLHRPIFEGNERQYLLDCIDSNFVSSVGPKVSEFEEKIAKFTGSKYSVATVNGTAALQVAIELADVTNGDEVLTQSLTFIATCNAIKYTGASPIFIDVDKDTMGMSPCALNSFLEINAEKRNGRCINKKTGKQIAACIPMHTFGVPCRIESISNICKEWGISLIEDAAESLGSYCSNVHTGKFGKMATLSFNGNKIITTGGGGMIIMDDIKLAKRAKHITTTAKVPHPYEFVHDQIGYNYRMPNLNAALGCAQMERLPDFLKAKADVAKKWSEFFDLHKVDFLRAGGEAKSNHWLNAIVLSDKNERDKFLEQTNDNGIMTRPIWHLMSNLPMFKKYQNDGLKNSIWLQDRVVNISSSVPDGSLLKLKE